MDLRDDIQTNLADLSDQLHQMVKKPEQPSVAVWEEMRQHIDDLATYLDTFIIPRIAPATRYLVLVAFERNALPARPEPELIPTVAGRYNNGDEPDAA